MFSDPDPLAFLTMVRDDRRKIIAVHGHETGELYDLHEDPAETRNRWDDPSYRDVRFSMLKRLADRVAWTWTRYPSDRDTTP